MFDTKHDDLRGSIGWSPSSGKLHPDLVWKLNKTNWSVDEACWIFAGFTDTDPMRLTRYSDGANVPFGSPDYRYAQEEKDRIKKLMDRWVGLVGDRVKNEISEEKDGVVMYPKNWLVSIAVHWIAEYEKFPMPWLDKAYEMGRISGKALGRPEIVDSGPIEATGTATASASGEVDIAKRRYKVKPLKKEMSGIRRWVYDRLLDRSLTGYPQPTTSQIVDLIEEHYEHYREHDKIDIIYFDEETDEEKTWKVESLKKFIQHWVE
tara:strand:+ start:225 stop:1013 length:789 start_codon:yes stop_codon:yes gene_type:complete